MGYIDFLFTESICMKKKKRKAAMKQKIYPQHETPHLLSKYIEFDFVRYLLRKSFAGFGEGRLCCVCIE